MMSSRANISGDTVLSLRLTYKNINFDGQLLTLKCCFFCRSLRKLAWILKLLTETNISNFLLRKYDILGTLFTLSLLGICLCFLTLRLHPDGF